MSEDVEYAHTLLYFRASLTNSFLKILGITLMADGSVLSVSINCWYLFNSF